MPTMQLLTVAKSHEMAGVFDIGDHDTQIPFYQMVSRGHLTYRQKHDSMTTTKLKYTQILVMNRDISYFEDIW